MMRLLVCGAEVRFILMNDERENGALPFDGIICIGGEDWWYHNRGHFDFQLMRRFAKDWPVLFVNSIAVRVPSLKEKRQFAAKVGRKLRSLSRGLVRVENEFWVFSPVSVPGKTGQFLSNWALAAQIKLAAANAGIRRPLLWVHCPAGAGLLQSIPHTQLVLQRTDRFELFPEADPAVIGADMKRLMKNADLVVYCAAHLMDEERHSVKRQVLITHGVDLETFLAAGQTRVPGPVDVATLARPRVGFIGGIDAHTFGPELFLETARRLPDCEFVMIGGCSLPKGWCTLPNVKFLGRKPYEQIASYMAAMDVLIMPWNDSGWIKACNPIKLKEYLATGRPIVTTDFPALERFREVVRVADGPEDFARQIKAALTEPYDAGRARAMVASESWEAKAACLAQSMLDVGYELERARQKANVAKRLQA